MCSHAAEPGQGEKLRLVWADLAAGTRSPSRACAVVPRPGSVAIDDVVAILRRLRIPLPEDDMRMIIARSQEAARGGGGASAAEMTYAEFQSFGELFPTTLDCVYYRLRDEEFEREQRRQYDSLARQLQRERDKEQELDAAAVGLRQELSSVAEAVSAHQLEVQCAHDRCHAAKSAVDEARTEVELCRQAAADRQLAAQRLRDAERECAAEAAAIARRSDEARQMQRQAGDAVARGRRRVQDLEAQLRLARQQLQESETQAASRDAEVERVAADAAAVLERQDALAGESAAAAAAAAELEQGLQLAREREQQRQGQHRDAVTALDAAQDGLERAARAERGLRSQAEAARHAAGGQQGAAQRAEAALDAHSKEQADFAAQRRAIELEERPLVEEEALLRGERSALEGREDALRRQHRQLATRRAQSPQPAGRRAQSPSSRPCSPVPAPCPAPTAGRPARPPAGCAPRGPPLPPYTGSPPPSPQSGPARQAGPSADRFLAPIPGHRAAVTREVLLLPPPPRSPRPGLLSPRSGSGALLAPTQHPAQRAPLQPPRPPPAAGPPLGGAWEDPSPRAPPSADRRRLPPRDGSPFAGGAVPARRLDAFLPLPAAPPAPRGRAGDTGGDTLAGADAGCGLSRWRSHTTVSYALR
eukprot:TRINITY_DN2357_c0_g2_i1.p1 TRINITY_DN2357_c0_g2~~TRINITY_DN2357_c0_g2_i1.p1  ORF type:complete len:673 (+),score=176.97 TRINITY_DN2357_c0_g2_i1:81-2021(+)